MNSKLSRLTKGGLLSNRTLLLGFIEMIKAFFLLPPKVPDNRPHPSARFVQFRLAQLVDPNPHKQVLEIVQLPRD